jgi:hypothetical protein
LLTHLVGNFNQQLRRFLFCGKQRERGGTGIRSRRQWLHHAMLAAESKMFLTHSDFFLPDCLTALCTCFDSSGENLAQIRMPLACPLGNVGRPILSFILFVKQYV